QIQHARDPSMAETARAVAAPPPPAPSPPVDPPRAVLTPSAAAPSVKEKKTGPVRTHRIVTDTDDIEDPPPLPGEAQEPDSLTELVDSGENLKPDEDDTGNLPTTPPAGD